VNLLAELATASVRIPIGGRIWLDADITAPSDAIGVVLFAHGSGSSRQSPRNRFVARELVSRRFTTVLADLLTAEEEKVDARTGAFRFHIRLLAHRVIRMIDWAGSYGPLAGLPIGLFGASTGAAAALDAAAARPELVRAVVSRGGRPDLAAGLAHVTSPALLIVGERDPAVLKLNAEALRHLGGVKQLEVVPRATHLFEEPGALEEVTTLAATWFERYLS
jgi:putative phosphoribosyl transferase